MTAKKDMTFDEKLTQLKKIHARSHPEAKAQIAKWEDELARLKIDADWLKHPNTKQLKKTLSEQLDRIVGVLAGDDTLTETERKALFKAKDDVILPLLALLTKDPVAEMKVIENQVDENL